LSSKFAIIFFRNILKNKRKDNILNEYVKEYLENLKKQGEIIKNFLYLVVVLDNYKKIP
jgi:hypothetical protein